MIWVCFGGKIQYGLIKSNDFKQNLKIDIEFGHSIFTKRQTLTHAECVAQNTLGKIQNLMYWISNSERKQIETTSNLLVVDKIGTQKSNQRPRRINIDVHNPR